MATVIKKEKKKSVLSGVASAVSNVVTQKMLKERKDGDYYLKQLSLLGGLERLNNEASIAATATANASKPAMPKQRSAEDMAEWDDSDGDWTKNIAKAQGVDLKQPAFIANQPGFMKAQAAVAQREVTPRLDYEAMLAIQDPREYDEYRRSIGKDATFDYGALNIVPSGGGEDGRVEPLSPTQLEVLKSTKRPSSASPMAQDLGGWERAPGSKVRPVAGGGGTREATNRLRFETNAAEASDPVIANLRKEGGLVSIPTSERAWKSERVDRSTEPEVWQTSPEVLSSQGKLRDEMRANVEEEASEPPEHWETPSETMLRRAGSKARLARVTKEAGKKIKGMSEYEKAPEHVQRLARGGIEGLGMKQLEKLSRRDLEQVERIKAEFVRKRLREAGL